MKVYGWSDAGLMRGDMVSANVDAKELEFNSEEMAARLGWDAIFTQFLAARKEMVRQMEKFRVDPESIGLVKSLKARDVPEV